jgi:hypothetical protein
MLGPVWFCRRISSDDSSIDLQLGKRLESSRDHKSGYYLWKTRHQTGKNDSVWTRQQICEIRSKWSCGCVKIAFCATFSVTNLLKILSMELVVMYQPEDMFCLGHAENSVQALLKTLKDFERVLVPFGRTISGLRKSSKDFSEDCSIMLRTRTEYSSEFSSECVLKHF